MSRATSRLGQIGAALVLIRVMSPAAWADMALLLSIYIAGLGAGTLNLHQGILFFFGTVPEDKRRAVGVQTVLMLAVTGLLTAAAVLAAGPVIGRSQFAIGAALPWLALALALEIPTLAVPEILIATERPRGAALFEGALAPLQVAALIVPIVLGADGTASMQWLCGYGALRVVILLVLAQLSRSFRPGGLTAQLAWEQIKYCAPLGLAMGVNVLNRNIDKWLVAYFDPSAFGAFALVAQEIPLVPLVPYAAGIALATRMVHSFKVGDVPRAFGYWLAQTSRMSLFVIPASLVVGLCGPELVALFYTEAYLAGTLAFQIYAVILLHRVAEYGLVLRASGDTRGLTRSAMVLLVGNVAVGVPLAALVGSHGVAFGTVLANGCAWFYVLHRISGSMGKRLSTVFPWRLYGHALLLGVVGWAFAALLMCALPALPLAVRLLVKVGLFFSFWLVAARVTGLRRALPPLPADHPEFSPKANLS